MFEEKDPIFDEENQKKLIEQIASASDCKIYGVNRFNQRTIEYSMVLTVLIAVVISFLLAIFFNPVFSVVLKALNIAVALIVVGVLSYLRHSHKYFKTFVSELGIAKKSEWEEGAIPWGKIEYIEIKNKGDEIDYIIFRSDAMKLRYRNSRFVTRLTLEIISEYIGGIERWHMFDDLKETAETTDSDRIYMKPDIEKSAGLKKLEDVLLMEWIGEQDFDADQTQEHTSSKSDDELYELILNDPQCEYILDSGRLSRTLGNSKATLALLLVAFASMIYGVFAGPYSVLVFSFVGVLFFMILYGIFKNGETLVASPIGIARFDYGSPVTIEWQHVEFIDIYLHENSPEPFEFFGNKRRVFCPEHWYKGLISMEMIRKYVSNLDEWKKTKRDTWDEKTYRLVRPDA